MKPPGGLRPLNARLEQAHRNLTERATFAGVLEELNAARAVLADFRAVAGTDRSASITDLENARRKLWLISLAARNLIELESGLDASGRDTALIPTYLTPAAPASGCHLNVEA